MAGRRLSGTQVKFSVDVAARVAGEKTSLFGPEWSKGGTRLNIFGENSPLNGDPVVWALRTVRDNLEDSEGNARVPLMRFRDVTLGDRPQTRTQFLTAMGFEVRPVGSGEPDKKLPQDDRSTLDLRLLGTFGGFAVMEATRSDAIGQITSVSIDLVTPPKQQ